MTSTFNEDELSELEEGSIDDARLAELEEESGIWDDPEKFTLSVAIRNMGTVYEYLLAEAKRTFSHDDRIGRDDIDGLISSDNVEIDLSDEEYETIAREATGNSLADEE